MTKSSPYARFVLFSISYFTLTDAYVARVGRLPSVIVPWVQQPTPKFEKEADAEVNAVRRKRFLPWLNQKTTSTLAKEADDAAITPQRLSWQPEGHSTWQWNGQNINYIEMGDKTKPALLLIHGFGASAYHFRSNIPELSKHYHVFAFDMLGFGCSSRPVQEYEPEVWRDQTVDFVKDVIGKPTTIAGNSLGGLAALYASCDESLKPLVSGCILMNAALRFRSKGPASPFADENKEVAKGKAPKEEGFVGQMLKAAQRLLLIASFEAIKRPEQIENVLRKIYPVNSAHVDEELIASIHSPSLDENAAEIYCRVLSKNGPGTNVFADDLLAQLHCPLLLCWGTKDPWFKTTSCDKIQALYGQTERVDVHAGHAPHDEAPKEVNAAIHNFLAQLQ